MAEIELYLIMNKKAGSGNAEETATKVLAYLERKKLPYQAYTTEYQGHAIQITQELLTTTLISWSERKKDQPFPLLAVLGGDGTLHEIVNTLGNNFSIPIAYIPSGSGNDFARGVNISQDPLEALKRIYQTKEPQPFNILTFKERIAEEQGFFTNNLGIGLDARIVAHANASKSKEQLNRFNMGSLTYLSSGLKMILKQEAFPIQVSINGAEFNYPKAYLCTVANHPYFGGGLAIAPEANIQSNEFEIVIVDKVNFFSVLHLVTLLLRKKHLRSKHVHHFKGQKLRLISTTSQHGQTDGEVLGERPYDLTFSTTERLFWL